MTSTATLELCPTWNSVRNSGLSRPLVPSKGLKIVRFGGKFPLMTTVKVDDSKRVRIASAKPGQVFALESKPDGSIVLTEVIPKTKDAPIVNPVRTKEGFLNWPVKLDRKEIAAAIRADRDAR